MTRVVLVLRLHLASSLEDPRCALVLTVATARRALVYG
jgi:hypothetical protein